MSVIGPSILEGYRTLTRMRMTVDGIVLTAVEEFVRL